MNILIYTGSSKVLFIFFLWCWSAKGVSGKSNKTFMTCMRNGCNQENLASLNDDTIVGLWQELPINCEHCKGGDCQKESKWILERCMGNENQKCSTVFGPSGDVIERGCSDLVSYSQHNYCLTNPSKCINCKSNGCNYVIKEEDLVECYTCEHSGDCKTRVVKCFGKCMVAVNPKTKEIYRGCLNDKELDDIENCDKDSSCKTCNTPLCNNFDLDPINKTTCFFCSRNHCENSLSKLCNSVDSDQCYTLVDENQLVVSLGCKSDLDDDFINVELKDRRIHFCNDNECNDIRNLTKKKKCYSCNSLDEPGCAVSNLTSSTYCNTLPYLECYKRILLNGHTERGCLSNLKGDEFLSCLSNKNSNCQSCIGDNCNDGLVQSDRLQCFQCNSKYEERCVSNVTKSSACLDHVEKDVCVSKFSLDGTVIRGCQSKVLCKEPNMCKECEGNNCNKDIFNPPPSLSCNFCEQDCEIYFEKKCSNALETECYIRFNEAQSITHMGCKNDLNQSDIDDNFNKFIFCDGHMCNKLSLIKENTCVSCNSYESPDCVLSSNNFTVLKPCRNLANTNCYIRITQFGHTERGCIGDLNNEHYKNCLNGRLCEICDGKICNTRTYPNNRLECLFCSSVSDNNCFESPQIREICPVYNQNQVCVSKITTGNEVIRGCSEQNRCDNESFYDCEICDFSSCNKAKLLNLRSIGKPGRWQSLPLTCLQCEGDDCATSTYSLECQGNIEQNCVTVFSGDKVISRGCADAIYKTHINHCRNNPGSCHECKSNNCNNLTSNTNFTTCIFCDSSSDSNCAENIDRISTRRQCMGKCMSALYTLPNSEYEVVRSCLNDKESADIESCNQNNCLSCAKNECNIDILNSQSMSCNYCLGNCEVFESITCNIQKKNDQCFIKFDETIRVTEMGCANKFTEQELKDFAKNLFLCSGNNCNDYNTLPTVNDRIECNSNKNVNCAINPTKIETTVPHTTCYSRINTDGSTERGCLIKLVLDDFSDCHLNLSSCKTCSGKYCNTEIFPVDRPHCHWCNSSFIKSCQFSPDAVSPCPVFHPQEQCVTVLEGETVIRGCEFEILCNDRTCIYCSGNGCNEIKISEEGLPGLWQDLPLKCYKCEGEQCGNGLEILSACSSNNIHQNCLTIFEANGKLSKKGCSDDFEELCLSNQENCLTCKSNGCNNVVAQNDYVDCLFCDSKIDLNCKNEPSLISKTRKCHKHCMVALYLNSSSVIRSCLDDKELDDRETCVYGYDSKCVACEEEKCNVHILSNNKLLCWTCEGDECEIPESQYCPFDNKNDKCFIKFQNNEVIQMGCISSFNESMNDILKNKNVLTCDGDNCNKHLLNNIMKPQLCQVCQSSTEINCAVNPSLLGRLSSCSYLPYPQCYTKIKNDGSTERGCLSSLEEDDFLTCLNNNATLCSSCFGGNCNNLIFPETRLHCHQCNSDNNPDCGKSLQGQVCPIYSENESCVSFLKKGVTYRGCATELKCDESDSKKCKVCNTSHCNTHDLEDELEISVGEPGLWQDLPLECYKCERNNCDFNAVISKCIHNNLQLCTTVFNLNGFVEKRGCSDEILSTHSLYCKQNPKKCISCKSNGCNINNTESDYIDCAFCNSETDISCVLGSNGTIRKCYKSCMTALYPISINDQDPAFALVRSCLDDKEIDDQKCCTGKDCEKCSNDKCNIEKFPKNRLTCYRCQGLDCEEPVSTTCRRYRNNDVCYTRIDDSMSVIQKGCGSDLLSDQIKESLLKKQLYTCKENNCNSYENLPEANPCILCNSKTDPSCAINPLNFSSITLCDSQGYNQCYSRVLIDKHTERGCLSNLEGEEFVSCLNDKSASCEACVGPICNNQIYPKDRISCNTCSSDSNEFCTSSPNTPEVCLLYDSNQFCYSTLTGLTTIRGCGDESNCIGSKCNTCKGHNCNTIDFTGDSDKADDVYGRFVSLPLDCYICKNNCSVTLGVIETCQGRLEQDCITIFGEHGKVVERGCSDQIKNTQNTYCNKNPGKCYTCKSNECNIAWNIYDYIDCISCDSMKDVDCITKTELFRSKKCHKGCMNAIFPSNQSSYEFDLHRGCLDDKDVLDQLLCDGKTCNVCKESNCNQEVFPSDRLQCHRYSSLNAQCTNGSINLEYCPLYNSNDTCVTYTEGNIVTRGCYSDNICLSENNKCILCSDHGCNSECNITPDVTTSDKTTPKVTTYKTTPDSSKGCYKCNRNCEDPVVEQCKDLNTECYILYEDGFEVKEMGCKNEYENLDEIPELIKEKKIYVCNGNKCNDIALLKETECTICNSENEFECASNMNALFEYKKCRIPYSQCYSRILENGHTDRGCIDDLFEEEFIDCLENRSGNCSICNDKHICNQNIYPADRLLCETCKEDCEKTFSQICLLYKQEKCFANFDENGFPIQLGCSSDIPDIMINDWKNKSTLYECSGKSCNIFDNLPQNKNCLVCDSNNDSRCATAPEMLRGTLEKVCLAPNSKCYSRIDGTKTIRGCLRDLKIEDEIYNCENNIELCEACEGEKCNDKIFPVNRLSCYICRDNNDCLLERNDKHNKTICPLYNSNDKCIAHFNKKQNIAERDCVSTNNSLCDTKKNKSCQMCSETLCNIQILNNAYGMIANIFTLLLGILFTLYF